ncbi:Serine racemase CcSR [Chondrus crispus]|uniref:Serine racemase CcSR n=1 Tax=Chondrus crispus TaxID=2769 RepID=R7Q8R7_CHOCR|nr:Serine racemase CcSR [Chondrus crispus]CDF33870.1 Serine racemase CcSR [Chondrus crispus]|eukprot:XP_005713689.1 Serine racemase CcSR [Chondrus crispus]
MPSPLEDACASTGVSPATIREASERIRPHAHVTPILTSSLIDAWLCGSSPALTNFFFKAECFQKTGSFKFRGALNAVGQLQQSTSTRGKPVVTHSSGNHAQALSAAAQVYGVAAHVVIPQDAIPVKSEAARAYGGTIHECAPGMDSRRSAAEKVLHDTGGILVHPFLDPNVVSGQGTIGIELIQQVKDLNAIVVPVGGGGLISGITIAVKSACPHVKIIGAEAALSNAASRSLAAGKRIEFYNPSTIADGIRAGIGELGWEVLGRMVEEVVSVQEPEIEDTMKTFMERMKVVIEPSAAVAVAACKTKQFRERGFRRVAVVLCGGNVDLQALPWNCRR